MQPRIDARDGTRLDSGHAAGPRTDPPRVVVKHPASHHGPTAPTVIYARKTVDDAGRRWIAENLMIGVSPESVLDTMTSAGFAPHEAVQEINAALQSPYFLAAERLNNRLRKRDWVLAVHRKLTRLHPNSGEIPRRHKLAREEFLADYYSANRPVIITGMMEDWPALRRWDLDYFAGRFGDREVEVQMGRNASPHYEINADQFVTRIRFGDFLHRVRSTGETNDFYLTAHNDSHNRRALSELWEDIVQVPEYLRADQPGGFFWMGPRGTITPFHHDLTNNFMAQVIGRKHLKIAPSWDLSLMHNFHHCFSLVDGRDLPADPQPAFDQPQILECTLHPGEILFLPVGWIHFVQGLDVTVTVSFTNFIFDNDFHSFYSNFGPV